METGEGLWNRARSQERVTQGFGEAACAIVLFDGDDATLFSNAHCELERDVLDRKRSNAPDLELVEKLGSVHVVQGLQDRSHSDDDGASTGLELAPAGK